MNFVSFLKDAARQERQAKDRLAREKDVLIAEKFTLEQNLAVSVFVKKSIFVCNKGVVGGLARRQDTIASTTTCFL